MTSPTIPGKALLDALCARVATRPIVVAHRGDSHHHPENTLAAFRSAAALGVQVQEFDVQVTGCGALVCIHDATPDRTTDAGRVLGPGARVAGLPLSVLQQLDAGAWKGAAHRGERIPTLAAALEVMLPGSLPMIEHKGGPAAAFVDELRRLRLVEQVLLQSFDWQFVAAARALQPELALGLLGPTRDAPLLDARVVDAARRLGVAFVHWHAAALAAADAALVHEAGLLLCTYTSDDELAWFGGAALGVDLMCTNDPARMMAALTRHGAAARRT